MKQTIILIIFSFLQLYVNSQEQPDPNPKLGNHLLNAEVNLPVGSGNGIFKRWTQGLVGLGVGYRYRIDNQFIIGVGAQYSYFVLNQFRTPPADSVRGGIHMPSIYLETGWEKHITDRFCFSLTLRTGATNTYFNSAACKKKDIVNKPTTSFFMQPTIGFCLMADEISSFRFTFGYGIHGFKMTPDKVCATSNDGFVLEDLSKVTTVLYIALGYTHYFGKGK